MSRLIPWRNKPSAFILEMIPVAKQYKLYLVHETGPTSFVFKDDNDNKFKVLDSTNHRSVTIGLKLSCSCAVVQNDHCLHTLFVMLKRFRVDETNPILWQASYLDNQLDGLVQMKYSEKKKATTQSNNNKFLKRKTTTDNNNNKGQLDEYDFPKVSDDDTCPICYIQLKGQCYSQCTTCHNCLHSKCLKVWAQHKQESRTPVTCPLCRSEFDNPIHTVLRDMERWASRFLVHKGTKCSGCNQKNIKGVIFRCISCQNSVLCKMCFQSYEHKDHEYFLMKENAEGEWVQAPHRNSLSLTKMPVYKLNRPADEEQRYKADKPIKDIASYILSVFPTLKDYNISQLATLGGGGGISLGVIGNEVRIKQICHECNSPGTDLMRRLFCGHTYHEECLKGMLERSQFECVVDGEVICKGLVNALGIKVRKRVSRPMVDVVFSRNNQELKSRSAIKTKQPSLNSQMGPASENAGTNMMLGGKNNISGASRREPSTGKPSNMMSVIGSQQQKLEQNLRVFRIKKKVTDKKAEQFSPNFDLQGLGEGMVITGISQQQPPQLGMLSQQRTRSIMRNL